MQNFPSFHTACDRSKACTLITSIKHIPIGTQVNRLGHKKVKNFLRFRDISAARAARRNIGSRSRAC
jgi:hypothetical protein